MPFCQHTLQPVLLCVYLRKLRIFLHMLWYYNKSTQEKQVFFPPMSTKIKINAFWMKPYGYAGDDEVPFPCPPK